MSYYNKKELVKVVGDKIDRTQNTVRPLISDYFASFHIDEDIFRNQKGNYEYPDKIVDLLVEWFDDEVNRKALCSNNINEVSIDFLAHHGEELIKLIQKHCIESDKKEKQIRLIKTRTLASLNMVKKEMFDLLDAVKKICGLTHSINIAGEFRYTDEFFRVKWDDNLNTGTIKYLDDVIERQSILSADDYTYFLKNMILEFKGVLKKYSEIYEAMIIVRWGEVRKNQMLLHERQQQALKKRQDGLNTIEGNFQFESVSLSERRNAHMGEAERNSYKLDLVDGEEFRSSDELFDEAVYNRTLDILEFVLGRTLPYELLYDVAFKLLPFEVIAAKYGKEVSIEILKEIYRIYGF